MKRNFNTSELPHIWAHQKQDEGKAGSFYFEGATIYSYGRHFPIATHHNDIVLFTYRTYSKTTAKHISYTHSAISHKTILFCNDPKQAHEGYHGENVNDFIKRIKNKLQEITPKTRKPEIYLTQAAQEVERLKAYTEYFKLKLSADQKAIVKLVDLPNASEKLKELAAKKQAKQHREVQKRLKLWKAYDPETRGVTDFSVTYLRTNGQEVETSKGIRLSVPKAKLYYTWVQNQKECKGCNFEMQGILKQWKIEADAAIKTLEELTETQFIVDSKRTQYNAPTKEEIEREEQRIKSGYYDTDQIEQRKQAQVKAELQRMDEEAAKQCSEINEELSIKKQLFVLGGNKYRSATIFYNHNRTIKFNWSTDKLTPQEIDHIKANLVLPDGVVYKD